MLCCGAWTGYIDLGTIRNKPNWSTSFHNVVLNVPISPAAVCDLQGKTATALESVVQEAHTYLAGKPEPADVSVTTLPIQLATATS